MPISEWWSWRAFIAALLCCTTCLLIGCVFGATVNPRVSTVAVQEYARSLDLKFEAGYARKLAEVQVEHARALAAQDVSCATLQGELQRQNSKLAQDALNDAIGYSAQILSLRQQLAGRGITPAIVPP